MDTSRIKKFRHIILFAKGHYDIPNSEYWNALKTITDDYLGHNVSDIMSIYNMSTKARLAIYGETISVEQFNSRMIELFERNIIIGVESEIKMSPVRYMIATNLSFLQDATSDITGGLDVLGTPDLKLNNTELEV